MNRHRRQESEREAARGQPSAQLAAPRGDSNAPRHEEEPQVKDFAGDDDVEQIAQRRFSEGSLVFRDRDEPHDL